MGPAYKTNRIVGKRTFVMCHEIIDLNGDKKKKKETDESLFSDDTHERCDVFCIPNGTCGLIRTNDTPLAPTNTQ